MTIIKWLEQNQIPCIYKKYIGIDCPGCGIQSAVIELLKGNFYNSIKLYPALLPLILMFIFLLIHVIFKIKNGANILKYLFIINIIIIVLYYCIKILKLL